MADTVESNKATLARACKDNWQRGTFKRQIAVVMLGFLGIVTLIYFARILVFTPTDASIINAIGAAVGPVYASLATMVVSFAGLAFGLDAWAKQIKGPGQ